MCTGTFRVVRLHHTSENPNSGNAAMVWFGLHHQRAMPPPARCNRALRRTRQAEYAGRNAPDQPKNTGTRFAYEEIMDQ
ncbi:MAG: hypothetical protein AB9M60_15790 [Leptothrix sp. (in: b-proteobacteria)]